MPIYSYILGNIVASKTQSAVVSPTAIDRAAAARYNSANNTYVGRQLPFDAATVNLEMRNHFQMYQGTNTDHTDQAATSLKQNHPNVNRKQGNSEIIRNNVFMP